MPTRTIDNQTAAGPKAAGGGLDGAEAKGEGVAGDRSGALGADPIHALQAEVQALRRRSQALIHQAGMAEVATTALHNVGNVLNSVNVSVSVVAQPLARVPRFQSGKSPRLNT